MTFTSHFAGNTEDRSGTATFKVGDIERAMHFNEFSDYHGVAQLLNEAYKLGRQAATRELASRFAQMARELEWV